jgi:hypothetical protein
MSGNISEWVSGASGHPDDARLRGGAFWEYDNYYVSSEYSQGRAASDEDISSGFRLASPAVVPEPSTYAMALTGLACGGYTMFRRRKRA